MRRSFSLLACFVLSVSFVVSACGGNSGGDDDGGGKKNPKNDTGEQKNSSGNDEENVGEEDTTETVTSSNPKEKFRSKLQGTWKSECSGKNDSEAPFYIIEQIFEKDGVTGNFRYFTDAECQDPTYAIIIHGNYEVGAQNQSVSDGRIVETSFERGEAAIFKNTQAVNDREICGYTDWKVGQAKVVNDELPNCVFAEAVAGFTDGGTFGGTYELAGEKRLLFYDGNDLDENVVYSRVD